MATIAQNLLTDFNTATTECMKEAIIRLANDITVEFGKVSNDFYVLGFKDNSSLYINKLGDTLSEKV